MPTVGHETFTIEAMQLMQGNPEKNHWRFKKRKQCDVCEHGKLEKKLFAMDLRFHLFGYKSRKVAKIKGETTKKKDQNH